MTALIIKSALAMLLVLAVVAAASRARASVRHLMLTALFGFLLLLPVAQALAPAIVPTTTIPIPASVAMMSRPLQALSAPRTSVEKTPESVSSAATPVVHDIDWIRFARDAYIAIGALMLGWLAIGVVRLRLLENRGEIWVEGTTRATEVAIRSRIRRAVLVVLSERVDVPLTFGFRRSTIVLPSAARTWSEEALARVLRHELEHVRREDWTLQLAARAACALYWPNPLVWVALRRFCLEAERACDDAVIGSTAAEAYAGQLVALARELRQGLGQGLRQAVMLPALGMASRSRLSVRVKAILDPALPRGPHGRGIAAAVAVVMLGLLTAIAPARLIDAATPHGREAAASNNREAAASDGREAATSHGRDAATSHGRDAATSPDRDESDLAPLGETLVRAAASGNRALIDRLLDAGVDVNMKVPGDGSALIGAAREAQIEMIEHLLDRGADPNMAVPGDGNPLIAAARAGSLDGVRILLDHGARIDDVVPGDENALIQACAEGHADVVQLLITRGADVNARVVADGNRIRTPLRMARQGGFTDIEQMLLSAGAHR